MRAIAAIFVLLFHIGGTFQAKWGYTSCWGNFQFGEMGVDIFFIISGFIIYWSNKEKQHEMARKEFIARRMLRIYPIYWLALFLTVLFFIIGRYFLNVSTATSLSMQSFETGGLKALLASFFLIPSNHRVMDISWTLSFEVIFYLFFTIFFFKRTKQFFWVSIGIWVLLCYLNKFYFHYDYWHVLDKNPFLSLFNPIIAEFFIGCALAELISLKVERFKWPCIILGMTGCCLSFKYVHYSQFQESLNLIVYGLPIMMFMYGFIQYRQRIPAVLVYLGNASYSIYLFHMIFFIPLLRIIGNNEGLLATHWSIVFYSTIILTVMGCCFTYSLIEKPLLKFCTQKLKSTFLRSNKYDYNDLNNLDRKISKI